MSMYRKLWFRCAVLAVLATAGGVCFLVTRGERPPDEGCGRVERTPVIRPDLGGITVPPNIAPLNFLVAEDGSRFFARIQSRQGPAVEVASRTGRIIIPADDWKRLLDGNRGEQLHLDVFVKAPSGRWDRFEPIINAIAREDIDCFVAYRKMHPTRAPWDMTINCRNLTNFQESEVLRYATGFGGGCANCHAAPMNNPDRMLIGTRSKWHGSCTLLVEKGGVKKIPAKFGYTAWHPSGRLAVYSVNDLPIFYHSARKEIRDTADRDSYLAYYLVDEKTIKPCPPLADKRRLENWPAWAPDGRHLYYCVAPRTWTDDESQYPPRNYGDVKYGLERIRYDVDRDEWGTPEPVLSSDVTGRSAAMPRVSPDGRWLTFCLCGHGFFPNWHRDSDLYLIDLEAAEKSGTYEYRRMEVSSERSESWHGWSLNSRWLVFSSKRDHGIFTRIYFCYVDDEGRAGKPFILPQRDPAFYDSCLAGYNTAEFLTGPIPYTGEDLERVVRATDGIPIDAVSMPTPKPESGGGDRE